MAKPTDSEIEDVYREAEARGLTRQQVDEIAIPLITDVWLPPTGLGSVRSHRQLRAIISAVRDAYPAVPERPKPVPLATPKQVAYIADLLSRRFRDGDTSGFMGVSSLITSTGAIDLDAIGALTRARASQLISSLRGDY